MARTRKKSSAKQYNLVLDVGTTGVKAFVFDRKLSVIAKSYRKLKKTFPKKGWVEQNPNEIIRVSVSALRDAVRANRLDLHSFTSLGITNQRETTLLWDKRTGKPVYPAIVWEDKRTERYCDGLQRKYRRTVAQKTGLTIDPYFSASKIRWISDNVSQAKKLLELNQLAFGTVDSWVLWNLCRNHPHITDHTNASRTLLFNVKSLKWDDELLGLFEIPRSILPETRPSQSFFGELKRSIIGASLAVMAVCGDQQASLAAAGKTKGLTKVTYGTGTFILQIIGPRFQSKKSFFTTLAATSPRSKPLYALEAKINCCGQRVNQLLVQKKNLYSLVKNLTRKVNLILKRLPIKPKKIVIDGGVTQYPELVELQAGASKIHVRKQKIFDGTALGTATLLTMKRARTRTLFGPRRAR